MTIEDVVALALTSSNWHTFQARLKAYTEKCAEDDEAMKYFADHELHGPLGQD